jgi:hypothetical protein
MRSLSFHLFEYFIHSLEILAKPVFPVAFVESEQEIIKIYRPRIVAVILRVMELVVGGIYVERKQSEWRPREIIPAVTLSAIIKLPNKPHNESEDVHLHRPYNNCPGDLNKLIITKCTKICSMG